MDNSSRTICLHKNFVEHHPHEAEEIQKKYPGQVVIVESGRMAPPGSTLVLPFDGSGRQQAVLRRAALDRRVEVQVWVRLDLDDRTRQGLPQEDEQGKPISWQCLEQPALRKLVRDVERPRAWWKKLEPNALRMPKKPKEGRPNQQFVKMRDVLEMEDYTWQSLVNLKTSQEIIQQQGKVYHTWQDEKGDWQEARAWPLGKWTREALGLEPLKDDKGQWKKQVDKDRQLTLLDAYWGLPDGMSVLVETALPWQGWKYEDCDRDDLIWMVSDGRYQEWKWIRKVNGIRRVFDEPPGVPIYNDKVLGSTDPWRWAPNNKLVPNQLHHNIVLYLEKTGHKWEMWPKQSLLEPCPTITELDPAGPAMMEVPLFYHNYHLHFDMALGTNRPGDADQVWNEMHCGYEWSRGRGGRSHGMRSRKAFGWSLEDLLRYAVFDPEEAARLRREVIVREIVWEEWAADQFMNRGTTGWRVWSSQGMPTWIDTGKRAGNLKKNATDKGYMPRGMRRVVDKEDRHGLDLVQLGLAETTGRKGVRLERDWTPGAAEEPAWSWTPPWEQEPPGKAAAERRAWVLRDRLVSLEERIKNFRESGREVLDKEEHREYHQALRDELEILLREYYWLLGSLPPNARARGGWEVEESTRVEERVLALDQLLGEEKPERRTCWLMEAVEDMITPPQEISPEELFKRLLIEARHTDDIDPAWLIPQERRREERREKKAKERLREKTWQLIKQQRMEDALEQYQDDEWAENQADSEREWSEQKKYNAVKRWLVEV